MIEHGTPDEVAATAGAYPDTGSLLEVTAVRAGYGDSTVLDGVSCHVSAGEFVALIGRNGVGKSTLMKAVTGRLPVRSGSVTWKGVNLERWPSHRRVRNGMRWVDEDRGIFPNLTVGENLAVAGKPLPRSLAYSVDAIMDNFPKLRDKSPQKAASLSGGEQRMLALARAIAARPELLMLDEFSEGLQPSIVQELIATLREANRDGLGVLMVEQNVRLAVKYAERAYVMDKGQIVHEGTTQALREDEALLQRYLVV